MNRHHPFFLVPTLGGLALLVAAASADIIPLNTTLVPADATYNRLSVELSYSGTGSGSDSTTSDASGTLPVSLDIAIDASHNATVNGIAFQNNEPGTVSLTDMHFQWSVFVFFSVWVDAQGVRATGHTPTPYSQVTAGGFAPSDHRLILNQGIITPGTSAPGQTPPAAIDLSVTPLETVTTDGQGSVTVSAPAIDGNTATYSVVITYPVHFRAQVDANTALTADGKVRSTGSFSRTIPPPEVTNLVPTFNGDNGLFRGSLSAVGSLPANVTLYWGRQDGGTDAGAWEHATPFLGRDATPFELATPIVDNQTYFYRSYAENAFGQDWADTTERLLRLSQLISLQNQGAADVTSMQVTLSGWLSECAPNPAAMVICWGSHDAGTDISAWEHVVPLGQGATRLLSPGAPAKALVPTEDMGTEWIQAGFNDSRWRVGATGVGYDTAPDYDPYIGLDMSTSMANRNTTCYVRVPFTVGDPRGLESLTLRMRYDDGFAAYINGTLVASANAPRQLTWTSAATGDHPDGEAIQFESFYISSHVGLLQAGENMLAIHGLNSDIGSSDFLIAPELICNRGESTAMTTTVSVFPGSTNYYRCMASNELAVAWAPSTATVVAEIDSDGDGMHDGWELGHFGSTNETGTADWDGDGLSNYAESYAGTDPTNEASLLRLADTDVSSGAGQALLRWDSVPGKTYAIDMLPHGLDGSWAEAAGHLAATPPVNIYTATTANARGFYRVRVE